MRTFLFPILGLLTLIVCNSAFTGCKDKNPPATPKYDTTIVVKYDTTFTPKQRIDTVRVDTTINDTLIEVENDRVVISYVYSGFSGVPDPFLNTHICYAFGKLTMTKDSVYTGFSVQNENFFKKIVALKQQNPKLKIQLSFSNCADGGGFSHMTAVPAYRKQFAKDCKQFCIDNGIDGVDLDWEFPGMAYNSAYLYDPFHDVDNYTELFKDIRAEFGSDYLLTYAGPTQQKQALSGGGYRYVDNMAVEPYVDWVNLMCYDFCSAPRPHNAMFCSDGYWDIVRTYRSYLNAEYPFNKLVLGVAFYGRHEFDNDKEWMYKEIVDVLLANFPNTYRRKWHNLWCVPYLEKKVNGEWTMWCSYDDPQSIAYKGNWAIGRGMHGLMYWEVEGDNKKKDLQHACWDAMKKEGRSDTTFTFVTDTIHYIDTTIVARKDTTITKREQ